VPVEAVMFVSDSLHLLIWDAAIFNTLWCCLMDSSLIKSFIIILMVANGVPNSCAEPVARVASAKIFSFSACLDFACINKASFSRIFFINPLINHEIRNDKTINPNHIPIICCPKLVEWSM